jgi:hypothetical protein
VKRSRKRVNFNDTTGEDVKLLMALKAGKGYEAAAKIAGLTTGQATYRGSLARSMGMKISPMEYRKSADLGDLTMKQALSRLGLCEKLMRDIHKTLAKHREMVRSPRRKR